MTKPAILLLALALVAATYVSISTALDDVFDPHLPPEGPNDSYRGKCNEPCSGHYGNCARGLTCKYGICKYVKPLGATCHTACDVCKEPYFCENGVYCKSEELKCGQACSFDDDGHCENGTYCNGDKCAPVKLAGEGEYCDSCYTCKGDLKCMLYHGRKQCRKYYY